MARRKRPAPATFSQSWPERECSDPAAEKIRLMTLRLSEVMAGRSIRDLAREVDLDHSAISDLLAGRSWPDSRSIAVLEVALDASIWPPHERDDV